MLEKFKSVLMGMKENRAKLVGSILVSLLIISALPVSLTLVKQRQEIRKRAEGPNKVEIKFSPYSGPTNPGASFLVEIFLFLPSGDAQQSRTFYVAGGDLKFNPDVFEVSEISCSGNLPLAVRNSADTSTGVISLTCSKPGGQSPLTLSSGYTSTPLGSFRVRIKDNTPLGLTSVYFTEAIVPDATTTDNLAILPNPLGFIIAFPAIPTFEPTPTPVIGPQIISETGGTIERNLYTYWCLSWYFGCRQFLPVLSYNATLSQISVDFHWYANNNIFLQIKEGGNYISPVVIRSVIGNARNWLNFTFDPPVSLCASKTYGIFVKKGSSGNVTWFTKPGDSLSTTRNYKAWLTPGGNCSPTTPGQPTPTPMPTAMSQTPTPIRSVTPTLRPTPTQPSSGEPNISETRGDIWINTATSYSTGCNLAYKTKVDLPGQKVKKIELQLKWTSGGGSITMALQKTGTTTRSAEKTIYLPNTAGENWLTFDFSSAPVAVQAAAYEIFLKKAGTATVQWKSKFIGPNICDYARNHKIWLTP